MLALLASFKDNRGQWEVQI